MRQAKSVSVDRAVPTTVGRTVPFYSVSAQQWQQIPRAIPNIVVLLASWIPLIGLNIYLFRFAYPQHEELELGKLLTFSVIAACIAIMWAAARIASWLALAATAALYLMLEPTGNAEVVLLCCAGWFALLGLLGLASQCRMMMMLRRWRAEASSTVMIPSEQLGELRIYRQLPSTLWYLALGSVIYPMIKLIWQMISDHEPVFSTVVADRLDGFLVGSSALVLCVIVVLVRFVEQRIVGDLALEIPLTPDVGPLGFVAVGAVIEREAQDSAPCACLDPNEESKTSEYAQFVECLDRCARHGIEAVNALSAAEFSRVAHQPWVYGEHANDRLVRSSDRLVIAGFSGWDSKPVRLSVQTVFRQGTVSASNFLPLRAKEPFSRSKRQLKWRNCANSSLTAEEYQSASMSLIDQIPLGSQGLSGYSVRVVGRRPFLVDHPVR